MNKWTHSGNVIIVGFGISVILMGYLVYSCIINPSDLTSTNYYDQEIKFQEKIDAQKNTLPYSNQIELLKKETEIVITIPHEINKNASKISLYLYSIANKNEDKEMDLIKNETGLYTVNTSSWTKSNARLKLDITSNSKKYFKEFNY
jgi:hypothetical protein